MFIAKGFKTLPSHEKQTANGRMTAELRRGITNLFNVVGHVHSEEEANDLAVERALRQQFRAFLKTAGFRLAQDNFEGLLREKKGKNFKRNDGTIGWYHEAIPVMMALALVRAGKKHGGLDVSDLEPYGGLEVMMSTEFRHDSIEDNVKKQTLRRQMVSTRQESASLDKDEMARKARMIVNNVDLMSQRKLFDDSGEPVLNGNNRQKKEDSRLYVYRMLTDENSSPIVFMNKQMDVIQNLSTMLCAPKFTAQKRLEKCNGVEDKFGGRHFFAEMAKERWPEFRSAIDTLDRTMGLLVYFNFRYLEYVDLVYPQDGEKSPVNIPTAVGRFLKGAFKLNLPEGFHPVHIFMKRIMASVDPAQEPEKYERLQNFMTNIIKPSLAGHEDKFPYLFRDPKRETAPAPVAM